jgi:Tfp pilus assembly protein PilV
MVEVIVSAVLIGTVLITAVPMLRSVARQQRAADRQQIALAEATNIMDRLTSRPWSGITPEYAGTLSLSSETSRQLPAVKLQVAVQSDAAKPAEKRIKLSLRWEEDKDAPAAPVELTAWVYERGRRP